MEAFLVSWTPLGPILGHFVAILWPLGPRGPQREAQGRPREAQEAPKGVQERLKSRPREAQERPRGSQKCSGEPKRGPREPLAVPREPKTGRESPEERTKQRLIHVCKEGGLGGSFPPALYKQGQGHLALRRANLFIVLFASVFAISLVFAVPCLLLCRAVCCALHRLDVLRCTDLRCTSYGSLRSLLL